MRWEERNGTKEKAPACRVLCVSLSLSLFLLVRSSCADSAYKGMPEPWKGGKTQHAPRAERQGSNAQGQVLPVRHRHLRFDLNAGKRSIFFPQAV